MSDERGIGRGKGRVECWAGTNTCMEIWWLVKHWQLKIKLNLVLNDFEYFFWILKIFLNFFEFFEHFFKIQKNAKKRF